MEHTATNFIVLMDNELSLSDTRHIIGHFGDRLSRQSIVLALTIKQEPMDISTGKVYCIHLAIQHAQ